MAPNRLPIIRPVFKPPVVLKPIVKQTKPLNPVDPTAAKPLSANNSKTAEFNLNGQAAKATLFKKLDAPNTSPTGAPPTQNFAARATAPVAPVAGNVPAAPGQLSLAETKGASGAAYDAKNVGEVYRFGDGSNWRVDKVQDNKGFFDSGFKAVAMRRVVGDNVNGFKDDPTDNRVAVAFAGTGGLNDIDDDLDQGTGLLPQQYKQGIAFTNEVRSEAARNCETVTATGHSLGGGIASYVAVETGIPATAINSAPLAKNNIPESAGSYGNQITQYHNNSEFLTGVDNSNPFDARPGRDVVVSERYAPEEQKWYDVGAELRNLSLPLTNHKLGNTAVEFNTAEKIYG